MASKQAVRTLFRTFLREQRNSNQPRSFAVRRQDPISMYVRMLLRDQSDEAKTYGQRRLENVTSLLQHGRVHEALLARYNPVYGKSEQERIKATANRVGLDVPKEYEDAMRIEGREQEEAIDAKYRS